MANSMRTVTDLMVIGLKYTLDFEQKAGKAAKTMAEASQSPEAKQVFEQSVSKSSQYADRISEVFRAVGEKPETEDNHIVDAMLKEVEGMIKSSDEGPVRDAALIVAANQMQHFRVANYGSLKTYAELLGKADAARSLDQNLEDSKGGDEKLTRIAEKTVNPSAMKASLQPA